MAKASISAAIPLCNEAGCERAPRSPNAPYCGMHYMRRRRAGLPTARTKPTRCSVEGCVSLPRSGYASLCEVHYGRLRRYGRLELAGAPAALIDHSNGYKLLYSPGHPLTTRGHRARVYQHRAVYHAQYGDGPFECYHCAKQVTWADMHVDHLDDDPTNNAISNLAASCPQCNQQRGHAKAKRTIRATRAKQIAWQGATRSLPEWAETVGLSATALRDRIRAGWTIERALTEPQRPRR